jgi:hypothetical protein
VKEIVNLSSSAGPLHGYATQHATCSCIFRIRRWFKVIWRSWAPFRYRLDEMSYRSSIARNRLLIVYRRIMETKRRLSEWSASYDQVVYGENGLLSSFLLQASFLYWNCPQTSSWPRDSTVWWFTKWLYWFALSNIYAHDKILHWVTSLLYMICSSSLICLLFRCHLGLLSCIRLLPH